jgi:large subunit ribosomal protein L9
LAVRRYLFLSWVLQQGEKFMQLVLVDDVIHLGRRGDIVRVANGYGRNYLIPEGLAIPATKANLKIMEMQKKILARKASQEKESAEILGGELAKLHLVFSRKAGETGVLFGSVTSKDLTDLLEKKGLILDRRKIELEQPLKSIGNFTVKAYPHPEVPIEILISVTVEGEEPLTEVLQRESEQSTEIMDEVAASLQKAKDKLASQQEALPSPEKEGRTEEAPNEENEDTVRDASSEKNTPT